MTKVIKIINNMFAELLNNHILSSNSNVLISSFPAKYLSIWKAFVCSVVHEINFELIVLFKFLFADIFVISLLFCLTKFL